MDWTPLQRHAGRVALGFSGGKDSTILLWMLRHAGLLDRVTVYHLDTGDLLPEMQAHVAALREWCPHFVTVRTDARGWAAEHGEPSDLVPHSSHEFGQLMEEGRKLSARYDCCAANLMAPVFIKVRDDGNTLLIRGTREDDMKRLPARSGDVIDGMEFFYPLQSWTESDVFAFVRRNNIPLPALYDVFKQGPECATCPAWWNEGRAPYLKARHPALFAEYRARMARVVEEVTPCLRHLNEVLADLAGDANELGSSDGLVIDPATHLNVGPTTPSSAELVRFPDNAGFGVPVGEGAFVHDPVSAGRHFNGAG